MSLAGLPGSICVGRRFEYRLPSPYEKGREVVQQRNGGEHAMLFFGLLFSEQSDPGV